jgi:hypothetical protein
LSILQIECKLIPDFYILTPPHPHQKKREGKRKEGRKEESKIVFLSLKTLNK